MFRPAIVGAAAAAFALAACERQEPTNNLAIDGEANAADEMVIGEPETGPQDPATGNLTLESPPSQVEGAINQTDAQANLGNAVNLQ